MVQTCFLSKIQNTQVRINDFKDLITWYKKMPEVCTSDIFYNENPFPKENSFLFCKKTEEGSKQNVKTQRIYFPLFSKKGQIFYPKHKSQKQHPLHRSSFCIGKSFG